jgi:adenylosuccinate lyase
VIERYTTPQMATLWSLLRQYETWLDVELAACAAMERKGLVPEGVARHVRQAVTLDPDRIAELEDVVRHDVIAFLQHVEEQAGEQARHLHLGMTSSDVLDSSLAMRMVEAMDLILPEVANLREAAAALARTHRDTPMVGRSHGIHAEPTTAGMVFALWVTELDRNTVRLQAARETIRVGKISGAVGTYSGLPPEVETEALTALGLAAEPVASQVVQRDRHAEYLSALAITAATVEKIAVQIRHWQRTEVGEASEPFRKGQRGSSAMPHKKNPILTENATGLARLIRGYAGMAYENVALWHERDISHSSVERVAVPDATTAMHFMLRRMTRVLQGLVVDVDRMQANLDMTRGLVFSQAVLLALVRDGVGRSEAYAWVQTNALAAWDAKDQLGAASFKERLLADAQVTERLGPQGVERCFDLMYLLRHVPATVDRALEGTT